LARFPRRYATFAVERAALIPSIRRSRCSCRTPPRRQPRPAPSQRRWSPRAALITPVPPWTRWCSPRARSRWRTPSAPACKRSTRRPRWTPPPTEPGTHRPAGIQPPATAASLTTHEPPRPQQPGNPCSAHRQPRNSTLASQAEQRLRAGTARS